MGTSVALSFDGTTAAIGGPLDNSGTGAVWVFQWTVNGWAEQAKLVANDGGQDSRFPSAGSCRAHRSPEA